jgi:hypothetical protein
MLELSFMLAELNVGDGLMVVALGLAIIIGIFLLEDEFIPAACCAFAGWAGSTVAFGGVCPGLAGAALGLIFFLLFG